MWISRVRVNGGFLAGLDVRLAPGLNVVVGPRGTGKTTLIELIRHALGVVHSDALFRKQQEASIAKLLGSGEVVLDLEGGFETRHVVVDAQGNGRDPDLGTHALAVGQNELERIASNPASRLGLVDVRAMALALPAHPLEQVAFLTRRLAEIRTVIENGDDLTSRRQLLERERAEAAAEEERLLRTSSASTHLTRERLRAIENDSLTLIASRDAIDVLLEQMHEVGRRNDLLLESIEDVDVRNSRLQVAVVVDQRLPAILEDSSRIRHAVKSLNRELTSTRSRDDARLDTLRQEAEPLRAQLEAVEVGLGQVTARLRNIHAELADLDRKRDHAQQVQAQAVDLTSARNALLDQFEEFQESVFEARREVAATVSEKLEQHVTIDIEHLGDVSSFKDGLVEILQSSGGQYRQLADVVSKRVLPRQLLDIVESGDIQLLAVLTGLGVERAARAVAGMASAANLEKLVGLHLDDKVNFLLLDGVQNKLVDELSTGQKCAVTLPIILTERSRVLLLDQPEDHLDNAYLVRNVVTALNRRSEERVQTIVATHNANIPVLGSAEVVIAMESDGNQGFIHASGSFDEDRIVRVITKLMEGGIEAFRQRASFYEEHLIEDE